MPFYELTFIARQEITEGDVANITKEITDAVKAGKGSVHKEESWGLRDFEYEINKAKRGYYMHLVLETEFPVLAEIERKMKLHEDILRFLTIRTETADTEESPILTKEEEFSRDRDNFRDNRREERA